MLCSLILILELNHFYAAGKSELAFHFNVGHILLQTPSI